jgi:hypothetical protein
LPETGGNGNVPPRILRTKSLDSPTIWAFKPLSGNSNFFEGDNGQLSLSYSPMDVAYDVWDRSLASISSLSLSSPSAFSRLTGFIVLAVVEAKVVVGFDIAVLSLLL